MTVSYPLLVVIPGPVPGTQKRRRRPVESGGASADRLPPRVWRAGTGPAMMIARDDRVGFGD